MGLLEGGASVSTLLTALQTAISSGADSVLAGLGTALPVIIPVGVGILAVGVIWKFAKRFMRG